MITKEEYQAYREAAKELANEVSISPIDIRGKWYELNLTVPNFANVQGDADREGAFVECVLWVPKQALASEKHK